MRCPGGTALPGADPLLDCQASFNQLGGGNPQLVGERASTQALGLTWRAAPGLRVEIGGWRIDKARNIGIIRDSVTLDPKHYAQLAYLVQREAATPADLSNGLPGRISLVDVRLQNLGRSRFAGWDFELEAGPIAWAEGQLTATLTTARMTQAEQWLISGAEHVVLLDGSINGTPVQRWRHVASLNWKRAAWSWLATFQSIGSYQDENVDAQGQARRVGRWWTIGLSGSLRLGANEWSVGVANLLDRAPPFSNKTSSFAAGWDDLVHDPRGRSIWFTWKLSAL